ncbi:IS3 family transposase [Paenibacillus sp. NPDC057967]
MITISDRSRKHKAIEDYIHLYNNHRP